MADFPTLRTGAIMQYPASRTREYSTRVFRFIDGTEQRYRETGSGVKRWIIRLDMLTESEAGEIEYFFLSQQGRFESFSFTDPWDNTEYPNCSLESDVLVIEQADEGRARAQLIVKENRA